ncbi:MAG: cytochrome-c oxidase, cbb3-type subunit III [Xanthomonadaceae bacterium]|nr:cytochrome-c oxidase, cbb3-type subunit III [Xanthomonadaceae bacterium]
MSTFWSVFITVLVIAHLIGYALLLHGTSKMPAGSKIGETTGHVYDGDLEEYNNPLPRWWLWKFYLLIIFGFIYLALYPGLGSFKGLLGWSQYDQYAQDVAAAEERYGPLYEKLASIPIPELAKDPEAMQTGRRLFANNCAVCHGADARGAVGFPDLTDGVWLYGGTPEAIKTSILNGRHGVMPAWGATLGEEGVEQVAAYVYSLSGRSAPEHLTRPGAQKFATICAACHGIDGKGNQALGAPDLTAGVFMYGGSLEAIKTTIRDGRQGIMPAHRDILGEARAHIVAAYVYSLSAKEGDNHETGGGIVQ